VERATSDDAHPNQIGRIARGGDEKREERAKKGEFSMRKTKEKRKGKCKATCQKKRETPRARKGRLVLVLVLTFRFGL
jgi:hypothetical protein